MMKNQCQVVLKFVKLKILWAFLKYYIRMKEEEIRDFCNCEILKSANKNCDYKISTDTRTIQKGDLYLPLRGANFDGEKFIQDALSKGASGYFTTSGEIFDCAELIIKVPDTLSAYLELAQGYRKKVNPKVVAITGSSGKTTTKEMVYSVLSQKYNTVKTFSNHNNEIGFCQTVFSMTPDTEVLIIETGMRGLGEIELITKYAQPDYAIITNSGSAHIGRLGSLENIAKAKCEIAKYLNSQGAFIALNQDIIKNTVDYNGEQIYYSINDVEILEKRTGYSKFIYKNREYELNIEGDYNIENSLAAIETGYKLNLSYEEIKAGLASYHPIEKRWEAEEINGYKVINDSYNANPESMKASVKTFVELYDNPVVVLGNMGELGENEEQYHREVGIFLSKFCAKNVKYITVGNLAHEIGKELATRGFDVEYFMSNEEAACYILDNINIGNTIFLKASRSMKFEEIIEILKRGKV